MDKYLAVIRPPNHDKVYWFLVESEQEAQSVCDALQGVYDRLLYGCVFSVRVRSGQAPAFDSRLLNITER